MGLFKEKRDAQRRGAEARWQEETERAPSGIKDTFEFAKQTLGGVQDQQRLMQEGHPGQATVKATRDTGKTLNENPEVEFDLTVELDGSSYEVTHRQIVSRISLPEYQPGASVPVRVDPNDQSRLVIG